MRLLVEGARRTCAAEPTTSFATASCTGASALLPLPAPDAGGMASAMGDLYLLVSKRRDRQVETATRAVDAAQNEAHAAFDKELAALAREHAHREDSGRGVFASLGKIVGDLVDDVAHVQVGDAFEHLRENGSATLDSPKFWAQLEDGAIVVGKVAAVVASAAATVASFGAAGPVLVAVVIGVSLSAAGFTASETGVLQKLGMSDKAAQWTSFGCSLAGAIVTAGAGTSALAAQASQLSKAAHAASLAASGVSGASSATAASAHVERGHQAALAEDAVADRTEALHERARMGRTIDALIQAISEADKSSSRTLETLQGVIHTHGQCLVLSTARA